MCRLAQSLLVLICLSSDDLQAADERLYGGQSISVWQERIKSESLAELGHPDRIAGLLEILQDTHADWTQRRQAALTLGRVGSPAKLAVPVFIKLLNNTEADPEATRLWSLRALAFFGPVAVEATPAVARIVADQSLSFVVRATAVETLANIGQAREETLPVLLKCLQESGHSGTVFPELRIVITESIGLLGMQAVPAIPQLIRLLDEDDPLLQRAAAQSLARIGPRAEQAVPALVDVMLQSPGLESREAAAEALGALGADGIDSLGVLSSDKDSSVRRLAIRGLSHTPASPQQSEILKRCLTDSEGINRVEATGILLEQGDQMPKLQEILIRELASSDRMARISAYRILQKHPEQVESLRSRLNQLSVDQSAPMQTRDAAKKLMQFAP